MSDDRDIRVWKLDGVEDWVPWKRQMTLILKGKGFFEFLEGSPAKEGKSPEEQQKEEREEMKASATIMGSLSIKVQAQIPGDSPTPKEIWDRLLKLYDQSTAGLRMQLKGELASLKYSDFKDANEFVQKFTGLVSRHASTGKPVDEEEQVRLFLEAVGSGFEIWKRLKRAEVRRGLTIEDLTTDFLEESRNEEKESAFAIRAKGGSGHGKKKETCFKCGKKGHIAKDCWSKTPKDQGPKLNMAASAFNSDRDLRTAWFIDSGATAHICCQAELFEELDTSWKKPLDGLGGGVRAEGIGTVKLTVGNTDSTLTLKDVHLVPGFFTNLISVDRFRSSKDARLTYDGSAWTLIHTPTGTKVGNIQDYRGLYALDAQVVHKELVSAVVEPVDVWHARLGHISMERVRKTADLTNGISLKNASEKIVCETCIESKQERQISRDQPAQATEPMELIYTDVVGPIKPQAYDGSSWYLSVVDDATCGKWIYPMKTKGEAYDRLCEFCNWAEKATGKPVKRIRMDNGLEFGGSRLEVFLKAKGIKQELTVPYTPEQNGKGERPHKELNNMARTMIAMSGLTQKLWPEALKHAARLSNLLPTRALNGETPVRMMEKCLYPNKQPSKPDVSHLRIWGCKAWTLIPSERRARSEKFKPRSKPSYFVGTEAHNIFRIWMPDTGKVIRARDVTFVETANSSQVQPESTEDREDYAIDIFDDKVAEQVTQSESEELAQEQSETDSTITLAPPQRSNAIAPNQTARQIESDHATVSGPPRRSTRVTRGRPPMRYGNAAFNNDGTMEASVFAVKSAEDLDPKTFQEALNGADGDEWMKASEDEIKSLKENQTWVLVPRSQAEGRRVLTNKWVFRTKTDSSENLQRRKARLMVRLSISAN